MIANEIEKLIESGALKILMAGGIVSPKVKNQYEIYKKYCAERLKRSHGSVRDTVSGVAEDFGVSDTTVYTAIKKMRYE